MFFFKKSYCCVDAIFKNSYFYMIQKKSTSVLGAFQYKVLHDLRHHSVFIFDDGREVKILGKTADVGKLSINV